MANKLHSLLARQLRKVGIDPDRAPDAAALSALLDRVGKTYADFEQEHYLLERSQDIASREMGTLNEALRTSQARLASLLSLSSDWVWEMDPAGRFSFVSDGLTHRTGLPVALLSGQACTVDGPLRVSRADADRLAEQMAQLRPFHDITFALQSELGRHHHMRISGEPLLDGGTLVGWRGVGSDVTASVLAERKIHELARYDSLTGLPNRRMFMELLDDALERGRRGHAFALLFIDLDRFKSVNDHLGHGAGDELLRKVSARLRTQLRAGDLLARLGGDEFVVLSDAPADTRTLSALADRIIRAAAEPTTLAQHVVQVSASVGISIYPQDGSDAEHIVRHADVAMYHAKALGKNRHEFFTPALATRGAESFALEGDMRLALDRQEFVLHFQPQVDALTGGLVGVEALVRWQHPAHGLLPPGRFIELAEDSGLIVPLGRWVLQAACAQMASWRQAGLAAPRCAVNVSRRQLMDPSLPDDVRRALEASGIEPAWLEIEVTETMLMEDCERAAVVLDRLTALGVQVAIDDFGVGHSSMAYLKRFPASTLKIDRSFVKDLPQDEEAAAIARAIVAMGHSLGMHIVAEGVEEDDQRRVLSAMGCDVLQGYLFGRPMPATAPVWGTLLRPAAPASAVPG